ncbi:PQQ-binding-like beta-propeller repeat protein [Nannocystis punicea]|uniref:PQQ-binding-like beta-propeller repeat protein n=1 Tax=Nannocystis punicea TaxID=2995304 RepID=A0ABY7GWN8_9BACT|nr:PQQ-binding-like beta-propeller repeat protein [Nannocystis poenicansa]WAS91394.1 PQQ-binding-like beta-propeller repeat protein [Nannocystis poenicansa]
MNDPRFCLAWVVAVTACDPGPPGQDSATASTTSTSTTASTDDDETTTAPTTSGGPDGGSALGCTDVRWVHPFPWLASIRGLAVDSRQHVRTGYRDGDYHVLDIDPSGLVVGTMDFADTSPNWYGIDDQDDLLLVFHEDDSIHRLRKFDVHGAQLWEVEYQPDAKGLSQPHAKPGPGGTTVVTRDTWIFKYDADGQQLWEMQDPGYPLIAGVSAEGVIIGFYVTTTDFWARDADGQLLWQEDWGEHAQSDRVFAVDAGGGIAVGEQALGVARFTVDGTLEWERTEEELGVRVDAMAMNAKGQLAVLGQTMELGGASAAVVLDADGTETTKRACTELDGKEVAIDEAGRVVIGANDLDDYYVVSFD